MAQITYTDKEYLYENGDIPAKNKVQDTDMNQIKSVVNSNETKILLAVTDTAPAECSTGDKYFNTSTNLIYTATATDTWGSTGVAPTLNTIYVEFATQTAYAYNGTTLISVGGGSGSSDIVIVDPDTVSEDTKLYIESTDLDFQGEIVNDIYSTSEIKTNKIWIDGKPIYRKVVQTDNVAFSNSGTLISTGMLNVDSIIKINLSMLFADGNWYTHWHFTDITYKKDTNQVLLYTDSSATFTRVYVILEYTKTGGNS